MPQKLHWKIWNQLLSIISSKWSLELFHPCQNFTCKAVQNVSTLASMLRGFLIGLLSHWEVTASHHVLSIVWKGYSNILLLLLFCRVICLLDDLRGDSTSPVSFKTLCCEPDAPQPPKLGNKTKTLLQLKWSVSAPFCVCVCVCVCLSVHVWSTFGHNARRAGTWTLKLTLLQNSFSNWNIDHISTRRPLWSEMLWHDSLDPLSANPLHINRNP